MPRKKKNYTPADPDEERQFVTAAQNGDDAARARLVERYSFLAGAIARKYSSLFSTVSFDELVAEGRRGILEALQHYDAGRTAKFSTYAWFWVMKNVHEYLHVTIGVMGIPARVLGDVRKVLAAYDEELKKGKEPTLETIAKKASLSVGQIRELLADKENVSHPVFLDKPLDRSNPEETLGDVVANEKESTIQDFLEQRSSDVLIDDVLNGLEPTEAAVIRMRFGLGRNGAKSYKEIADTLKITSGKAKDIEFRALFKLRKKISEND